jgi:hypothetical protein
MLPPTRPGTAVRILATTDLGGAFLPLPPSVGPAGTAPAMRHGSMRSADAPAPNPRVQGFESLAARHLTCLRRTQITHLSRLNLALAA